MVAFTEEHEMFRATVRDVVEREINPHADEWERAGVFPAHDLFKKLGAVGMLGVNYDPAYGGGERMRISPPSPVRRSDGVTPSVSRWRSRSRPTWQRRRSQGSVRMS